MPLSPQSRVFDWVSPWDRLIPDNTKWLVRVELWHSGP